MAKIKSKIIKFLASDSPDVVTNRLYFNEGSSPDYASTYVNVGNNVDESGYVVVGLSKHFSNIDGEYYLGVTAVDDVGNESDMKVAGPIPLDFLAPNPVGDIILL